MAVTVSARRSRSSSLGLRRIGADQVAGRVGGERDPRQSRSQPVVEVPAQPASLLLERRHRLSSRLLHLGREGLGAQGMGEEGRRQGEHVLVVAGQREVAGAQPHDELGRGGGERDRSGVRRGRSRGRHLAPAVTEGGVRQDQRLADRPQRQQGVLTDPAGHRVGGVERVGPAAEQQLVDDPAQDDLQGPEGRRHQCADDGEGADGGVSPAAISSRDATVMNRAT